VNDGVYCAPCHLFDGPNVRGKTLVKTLLQDWSNAIKVLANHNKSEQHIAQREAADNFVAIHSGAKKDIEKCISSQYNKIVEKNRQILGRIVEVVIFCGKQNIALRGHHDEKGNFQALLQHQSKRDPILLDHLEKGDPRSKYLSPIIQNELTVNSTVPGQ